MTERTETGRDTRLDALVERSNREQDEREEPCPDCEVGEPHVCPRLHPERTETAGIAEPLLVSAMRRNPTGEARHMPNAPGRKAMLGTTARGFLHELDEWLTAREKAAARQALDEVEALRAQAAAVQKWVVPNGFAGGPEGDKTTAVMVRLDDLRAVLRDRAGDA